MKEILPIMGWVVLGLLVLVSFVIDLENTAQGGAIDLRNRITGVRLLEHQIDAYRYKWHEPEPAEYCDPYNNPNMPFSKTTATPALLMLHAPLAVLPYRVGQLLWFLLQWVLLLGTAWLWLRSCQTSRQRWLVALFVTGFSYTAAWRLHAERGQAYVALVFLFACWLTGTLDSKRGNGFMAGFFAGFLIALRLPFLLLAPFLVLHRRGQLAGAAVGLAVGVGLPLFLFPACWSDYFSAMQIQSAIYRADFEPHFAQAYPSRIEGVPLQILGNYVAIPYADFSVHALLKSLGLERSWLGDELVPAWPILLTVMIPFGLWVWWSRRQPVERLLPGLAAWFFLIDLFLPAYRNSYNDVLIVDVVAVGVVTAPRLPWAGWVCVLALPMGWWIYVFAPTEAGVINLPAFFLTVGAILFLFLPMFRQAGLRGAREETVARSAMAIRRSSTAATN